MKTSTTASIALCLVALAGMGCKKAPAQAVPYADACKPEMKGKTVLIEGYFSTASIVNCDHVKCDLGFDEDANGKSAFTAHVTEGPGKNAVATIPDNFDDKDIKFTLSDGSTAGVKQKLKVTGDVVVVNPKPAAVLNNPALKGKVHPFNCEIRVTQIDK
jgi:hypothetical protein